MIQPLFQARTARPQKKARVFALLKSDQQLLRQAQPRFSPAPCSLRPHLRAGGTSHALLPSL